MLGVGEIAPADLEQTDAVRAAVLVALCRGEQAGEQRRAHDLQIFADRIGERPGAPAKGRRVGLADERPGQDRKSVVWGKSVPVRVDLGVRRLIIKNNNMYK